ncbi:DUF3105 domain-containing protein [Conexibacter sp. SYSU D00693]|uniref:DUF3105 domain-containing protein n=1 Tax=Conexibacter sp. SYSU D00693 TaxID=2812560 RepID=UPI00196ACA92|nr:DUF3105 domain-containing protein [Conexibacter sp. SYSU D00693]
MASRQEEKERRRQEREAREQAEARKAAAKRRMQLVAGGVLAVAAIAAVVVAITSGGGDGGSGDGPSQEASSSVPIPRRAITDLSAAAKAAGCEVKTFPSEGREHSEDAFSGYKTNPPTSGTHNPTPAQDGIYDPGNEPAANNWVHTLEHGRILYQYRPGTPRRRIQQLETLYNEPFRGAEGYHQVVMQNNTDMPFAVAGVAWTHYVGCNEFNDKVFDALRAFRDTYVDKGPELIP